MRLIQMRLRSRIECGVGWVRKQGFGIKIERNLDPIPLGVRVNRSHELEERSRGVRTYLLFDSIEIQTSQFLAIENDPFFVMFGLSNWTPFQTDMFQLPTFP